MLLDSIDISILKENFDDEILEQLDNENVNKIYNYLIENGIYYAKDIYISQVYLFLLEYDNFVEKFEIIKQKLGENYIDIIGEDAAILESMYE